MDDVRGWIAIRELERRLREVEGQRDKYREGLETIGNDGDAYNPLAVYARAVLHDTETP